jgi:hypothetical protein
MDLSDREEEVSADDPRGGAIFWSAVGVLIWAAVALCVLLSMGCCEAPATIETPPTIKIVKHKAGGAYSMGKNGVSNIVLTAEDGSTCDHKDYPTVRLAPWIYVDEGEPFECHWKPMRPTEASR